MATDAHTPDSYPPGALPVGSRLGEFEVLRVLGVGGFGIVYLALDHQLEREVAVKEYMPASLAGRTAAMHVSLLSQAHADTFALGLRSFVNEAKLLARFDHPSLVKVYRFWEENATAYMAMPYYRGRTSRHVRLAMAEAPDEAWVRSVLEPLLGALEKLHAEGVYHRDIAPDNILIEPDGRPVLLDFGAARRVIGDRSQLLTAILKPSYAPIEQYGEAGSVKQGAWTDIYALGATVHFLLLGRPPAPAPARAVHDEAHTLADQALPGCSSAFLQLVDWMLAPRPTDRPQDVATLRQALSGELTPPPQLRAPEPTVGPGWERTQAVTSTSAATVPVVTGLDAVPTVAEPARSPPRQPVEPPPSLHLSPALPAGNSRPWLLPAALGALVLAAGAVWFSLQRPAPPTTVEQQSAVTPPPAPAPAPAPMTSGPPTSDGALVAAPAPAAVPAAPIDPPVSPPAAIAPPPVSAATGTTPAPGKAAERPRPPGAVAGPSATVPPRDGSAAAPTASRPAVASGKAQTRPIEPAVARPAEPQPTPAVRPPAPTTAPTTAPAVASPGGSSGKPAPAPQTAGAAEEQESRSPREACKKRPAILKWVCMDIQCGRDAFRGHAECVKLRADQEKVRAGNR